MKEENMSHWKKIGNFKIILLSLSVFLLGVTIGLSQSHKVPALSSSMYEDLKVFTDVLSLVQKDYVEETNPRDLVYGAIKGMLETLDPHSAFMTPETYREMQAETKGRFEGLGIEITLKDGVLTVVSPIEETPAFKAGILSGDQILKIDGEPTKNLNLMDSVKLMRPERHPGDDHDHEGGVCQASRFHIGSGCHSVLSVRHELLEKDYGYIRNLQFQEKTDGEFEKAIKALEEESKGTLKGLILDLRDDPGGLLDQAVKIADRFIESGLIVSMDGRKEDQKMKFFNAHPQGTLPAYPLVVIVNGGSASASEIVAGAIQDHRRGIILGTHTFGKGSVQTIFPLKDGSGLRIDHCSIFYPQWPFDPSQRDCARHYCQAFKA